jgi:hypothetical protein
MLGRILQQASQKGEWRRLPVAQTSVCGVSFSLHGLHKPGSIEKPTDWGSCYRPAGKRKSRIRKPAPFNNARMRHPKVQKLHIGSAIREERTALNRPAGLENRRPENDLVSC